MWIKLTADFKYCYLLYIYIFFFFFSLQWQDCCISAPAQHLWNSAGASTWSHQESLTQVTKILVFNSSCISPNHEIFSNTDNRLGNSLFFSVILNKGILCTNTLSPIADQCSPGFSLLSMIIEWNWLKNLEPSLKNMKKKNKISQPRMHPRCIDYNEYNKTLTIWM